MIITLTIVVVFSAVRSARSGELQAPGGFLVLPAIVLGSADFFLLFGNINDIQAGNASRGLGALGVTVGTATVLTAVGLGIGTDSLEFAVGIGVMGLATVATGVWAILAAETEEEISVEPVIGRGSTGIMFRWRW